MKSLSLLVLLAAGAFAQAAGVHTVYILPMAGGLDQYLAEWLTREHVLMVVTDPKAADAVLTDRLGEAFEQKMAEIHPPVKDKDPDKEKDKDKDKDKDKADNTAGAVTAHNAFRTTASRGTVFLVDAKSRVVLWSDHENPPSYASDKTLNREAERIVKKLQAKPAS
jgi:hypothetical protein